MRALALVLVLLALTGCAAASKAALGALGGGANVAANVQAGKSNVQSVGKATVADQRLIRPQARTIEQSAGETQFRTERVETLVVRNDVPPWVWLLAIIGWVLPTPWEILRTAWRTITRGHA